MHQVLPGTLVTIEEDQVRITETRRVVFEPRDEAATVRGFAAKTRSRLEACFGQRRDEGVREAGVLLSGGIDSSIMAAVAARTFPRCIAYTARIEGFANPELPRAAEVARRLGIEHRIVEVGQDDLGRFFPFVMARVQEPPRHFNNLVLARLFEALAGDVPFVVAGDAADLLFGGGELATLQRLERKRRWVRPLPGRLQRWAGQVLSHSANRRVRGLGRVVRFDMDGLIQRFDVIPRSREADALLRPIVTNHGPSDQMVSEHFRPGPGHFETFQQWHLATFLTSIFRRNHRLSAPFGLQTWYPLLEPSIVSLAARMPRALKIDPVTGESKPVLREICATIAGRDVAGWSKLGFPSPERELIAGPLHSEWVACTRPDARVARLLDPARLQRLDPSANHQTAWTLLTLEHLWRRQGAHG